MTGVVPPVTDDPPRHAIEALEEQVTAFNLAATGIADARWLSILQRGDDGALLAGLHGFSWGGYCEIRLLWVDERQRGRGLGSALLGGAEAEAIARGCDRIVLTTHSFQAPGFYARHGFECIAEIPDCPRGHAQLTLLKRIAK